MTAANFGRFRGAERRIEIITVCLGLVSAACAAAVWGRRASVAVALGSAFSWLNFRWLKNGVDTIAGLAAAQRDAPKIVVPRMTYLQFFGLYAVIILGGYAILTYFELPVLGILVGFFAGVIAVLIEAIGQLFRSRSLPRTNS